MATSPTAPRSLPAPATATTAFHLAAHLGTWGRREDFIRDNVAGTENALAACREAGVARFVHCSTEAALIAGRPLSVVDETAPLRPDSKALYCSTKALAERAVHAAAARGFGTVVLRPRFVWGRGDTTLLPSITAMVERGKFAWIGGGRQLTDTTHVDNVVEGLLAGAAHGRPGEAYFVTDGDRVVFRDFVSALLETQGVEPPSRSVPAWLSRRGGGRRRGGLEAAAARRRAATDQVRSLGLLAGMHDRHLQGPLRALLRASEEPRRGARRAPRRRRCARPLERRRAPTADHPPRARSPSSRATRSFVCRAAISSFRGPIPASMISIARSGSTSPASRSVKTRTSSATSGSSASL